jgi:PAS domain S-box-containing protein
MDSLDFSKGKERKKERRKPFVTKTLLKTSIDLSKARDFDSIAEILFDFVQQIIPINMSVLYILESDGQTLKPQACRGTHIERLLKRNLFHLGEGGVGYVGRQKRALLLTDVKKSTDVPIQIRQVQGEDPVIRSFLAVPLVVNNRLTGVLSASSSKPNQYTLHDMEIVSIVANQVSALVELYGRMEETQRFSDYIIQNMNSGVIVTDPAGTINMMNKMVVVISGFTHSEVRAKSLVEQVFLDPETKWNIFECLQDKVSLFETPGFILSRKGGKKCVKISSSHLLTGKDQKQGYIFIFRDVSQLEMLNEKLSRLEKLITFGKWTSSLSHEIRNSLLPIRTSIQLLKNRIVPQMSDSDVQELVEVLETESERLNRFLNELSGHRELQEESGKEASLFIAIEETISLIRSRLNTENIRLELPEPFPCWIPLGKDQLKQVFLNLFFNSIDALEKVNPPEGKCICINIRTHDDLLIVSFRDNGIGIPAKSQANLFEPFFTTKEKGTGLGLYNVQKMITYSGGRIHIESAEGKGTEVIIQFRKSTRKGHI